MRPPLSYVPLLPVLAIVVAFIIATDILYPVRHSVPDLSLTEWSGTVEDVTVTERGHSLTVAVPEPSNAKIRITVPGWTREYAVGDSISFIGRLSLLKARDRYENDYVRYLRDSGITSTAFVSPDSIVVTGTRNGMFDRIARIRNHTADLLKQSSLSDGAVEFLTAVIIGDDSILTQSARRKFTSTGVAHVLALSGFHVGIMSLLVTLMLFPLYLLRYRRLLLCVSVVILWCYAVFTCLSPSVTRAVTMATVMAGGIILQRHHFSLNALIFAAILILLFDPKSLYLPGFQLSFCAVASILLFMPLIERLKIRNRIAYYFTALAGVSVSASIGSSLIAAYYFHTFPLLFLITNIPVTLFMPVIMGAGVILLICEAAGYNPVWLCDTINCLYDALDSFISVLNDIPHSSLRHLFPSALMFVPYFFTVGMILMALYHKARKWFVLAVTGLVTTIACGILSSTGNSNADLFFIHSRFHTSLLYRSGNEAQLFTTAPGQNAENLISDITERYGDYLSRHRVDSVRLKHHESSSVPVVELNGRRIVLLNRDDTDTDLSAGNEPTDYLVLCRGFKGNPMTAVEKVYPDTVILSHDLHPKRHDRYIDSLTKYSIPYKSMRRDYDADLFSHIVSD